MWSLDGVLRYVPIGALHDGKGYLAEKYSTLVFTIASLTRLLDSPDENWRAFGLGVSKEHENFPALAPCPESCTQSSEKQVRGMRPESCQEQSASTSSSRGKR